MALKLPGYAIFNELSKNNHQITFQAIREKDQKSVLIKVLASDHPTLEEIAKLKNEYEIARSFDSTKVVKPLLLDRYLNTFFLVYEDKGLEPLSKIMSTVDLDLGDQIKLALSSAQALWQIQKNHIIHKDLQPQNLMVDLENYEVEITGLGSSTKYSRQKVSQNIPEQFEGRLSYISPEQTGRMNRDVDYRTDFYSLGAIFYELFTGQRPFVTLESMELVHAHIAVMPMSPHKVIPAIPKTVSDIIMKLLSKPVEERYSSATSLIEDLERCLDEYQKTGKVSSFPIGVNDVSASFQVSQKLYGRDEEIKILFDLVQNLDTSPPVMFLVKGYSGIGKSSLILEIQKPMIEKGGFFIMGKFDQFKTNIPYSAFIHAFKELIQYILTQSDDKIDYWKGKIKHALGVTAGVITEVIPILKLIIGDPPKVQELDTEQTHNRFSILFQQFITTFASKETPLVIFLDDLQWIDIASQKLIEMLMMSHQVVGLLLIGAYRSNEVDALHPLTSLIEKIKVNGAILKEIEVAPLSSAHVVEMLAETLHQSSQQCLELAEAITRKTEGNPYFINQLLSYLHSEKLLSFNPEKGAWKWDLEKIQNSKVSDNIVSLLIDKLQKCSKITQDILMLAACTGHSFNVHLLILISNYTPEVIIKHLQEAIEEGFITPVERLTDFFWELSSESREDLAAKGKLDTLKFPHDRVQQAAYSLIPPERRKEEHLKIGRILVNTTPPEELEEKIFDIVYQINNAESLIRDLEERIKYASYNFIAGEKAMKSVAYKTALMHLKAGLTFLPDDAWESSYDLMFSLKIHLAECSFLVGDSAVAAELFDQILSFSKTDDEKVSVYTLKIKLMISTANYIEAINNGMLALGILGVHMPPNATKLHVLKELAIVKFKLMGQNTNSLLNLPLINDKRKADIMNILFILIAPSYLSAKDLYAYIVLKGVRLTLDWGLSPYASYFFCAYGIILVILFGKLNEIIRYGKLSLDLIKKNTDQTSIPATKFLVGAYMMPYDQTFQKSVEVLKSSFEMGITVGDFIYGVYALAQMMSYQYIASDNIDDLQKDLLDYREFVSKIKAHNRGFMFIGAQQALMALKGETFHPWSMNTSSFNEIEFFQSLIDNNFPLSLYFIYVYKMQLLFLFGKYSETLVAAKKAEEIAYSVRGHPINIEIEFYYALAICQVDSLERKSFKTILNKIRKTIKRAAIQAPQNYLHKHLLIEAEVARNNLEHDNAQKFYDNSIEEAIKGGYIQNAAIAQELFAKYCLANQKIQLAKYYLIEAHYGYYCWGASAKVKELEEKYPELLIANRIAKGADDSKFSPQETDEKQTPFDLNSFIKASEILTQELEYESLIRGLMKIMTENAGAERAVLILDKEGKWMIEAEASANSFQISPNILLDKAGTLLPLSAMYYVLRTKESVVLEKAAETGLFTHDSYILNKSVKSGMAFPLIHQTKLVGALWLENNLNDNVFTPKRVEILKLLSSQIANSIENALLFTRQANLSKELQVSNAKLEDYSQNLERKVYLRTHEIKEKNEQLQETLKQIKEIQKKLVQQEKLVSLGAVTKTIASEIRTPLNYIFNFASISKDLIADIKTETNTETLKLLETNLEKINQHSKVADDIIMAMLEAARESELIKEPTDINKLIRDYADLVYYNYYKKDPQFSLSIETHWDPNLEKIIVIPQNIGRVIYNLIDNACYTTDQKKKENPENYSPALVITTKDLPQSIEIIIRDNGKGIAPELLSRIFTPFTSTKPTGKGAGMGLSLSYDIIVQEHEGKILIESEPDEWTEVTLSLPKTL